MIILSSIILIVELIVLPVILGVLFTSHMKEYSGKIIASWIFGIAFMFCEFQIMAVPLVLFDARFSTLFYLYIALVFFEAIVAFSRHKKELVAMIINQKANIKRIGFLGFVVLISILMQAFMLSYFEHVDDDDARFVPSAVAAIEKDYMFKEDPITGGLLYSVPSEVYKDMISPWIMFFAVIAKSTMVHPAIIMHSILPLILIPLGYGVYYTMGTILFDDDAMKKVIFTGIVSGINIFSGYSVFNQGSFMLLRIWQGKAIFASIFVPLLFVVIFRMFKNEKISVFDYLVALVVECGACLTSGFGIILTIILMGLMSVIYAVTRKNIKAMFGIWLTLIPNVVFAYLYAFGKNLFFGI